MGLLDTMSDDGYGLLSMGLRMMSTPGNFGQAFGQAGLGAMGDVRQFAADKQRRAMADLQTQQARMQMEEMARQERERQALQTYATQALTPTAPIDANNASGVMGPRPEALKAVGQVPGFNLGSALKAGVALPSALQLEQAMAKDTAPISVAEGTTLLDKRTLRPVFSNPKADKDDAFVRLMRASGVDPASPEGQALLRAKLQKDATHQPPVSVSYGAPVAGVDAQGNPVFFQPSKDGQTPPAIVQGVKPAPQNRDTKLPAELQRMQIAGDAMVALFDDYEKLLKTFNPRDPISQANPQVRADIQSLKRNIELQFKELQALGALAGPDIGVIRESLADPTSAAGAFYGRDGLLSQVKRARDLVRIRRDAVLKSQGQKPQGEKQIKRTGTAPDGRKVVEYTDGTIQYAD